VVDRRPLEATFRKERRKIWVIQRELTGTCTEARDVKSLAEALGI
jgi:hypothetical protein